MKYSQSQVARKTSRKFDCSYKRGLRGFVPDARSQFREVIDHLEMRTHLERIGFRLTDDGQTKTDPFQTSSHISSNKIRLEGKAEKFVRSRRRGAARKSERLKIAKAIFHLRIKYVPL